jgi:hypothetical protein
MEAKHTLHKTEQQDSIDIPYHLSSLRQRESNKKERTDEAEALFELLYRRTMRETQDQHPGSRGSRLT